MLLSKSKNNELFKKRSPGEIISINKHIGIKIMSKDFPLLIKYAQLEGKKVTDGYTLSLQTNLSLRNKFEN